MAKNSRAEDATENAATSETAENGVTGDTATDMATGHAALESNDTSKVANAGALSRDNGTNGGGDAEDGADTADPAVIAQVEDAEPIPAEPVLEVISALAARHRVPSWQLTALLRFMDWEDDRLVSDDDFRMALGRLNSRRIGGGRM